MNKLINSFLIKLRARHIGKDVYGNNYYEDRASSGHFGKKKRFIMYAGKAEASKVPAEWYCWVHHQSDVIPEKDAHYKWEIPHEPNRTGTDGAYYPKGHVLSAAKRSRSYGDYEAWRGE